VAAYTIWKSHVGVSSMLVRFVCAFVGMNKKTVLNAWYVHQNTCCKKELSVIELFEPCNEYCRCLKRDTVQSGNNLPKFPRNLYRVPPKRPQFSTTLLGFTSQQTIFTVRTAKNL
jgi:hypothetical protein